jgi:hypothetical protein
MYGIKNEHIKEIMGVKGKPDIAESYRRTDYSIPSSYDQPDIRTT